MNVYIVPIAGRRLYVRAPNKRSATSIAIEAVHDDTRMATHDDLIHVFKGDESIIGHCEAMSDTQDLPLDEPNGEAP